jgi:hypothetical protein
MCGCLPCRPHFVQLYFFTLTRNLVGGLGSRQSAANDGDAWTHGDRIQENERALQLPLFSFLTIDKEETIIPAATPATRNTSYTNNSYLYGKNEREIMRSVCMFSLGPHC